MNWFTSLFSSTSSRRKDNDGYFPASLSKILSISPDFNNTAEDIEKINTVLTSPAMLKVVSLQCDLFSLGKIYVYKGEEEIPDDPILDMFDTPNPMQSSSQWLWDMMFWTMIGSAYCYVDNDLPAAGNKLYFIDPSKMEFPREMEAMKDKLILSKKTIDDINKMVIKYRFDDGTYKYIPYGRITTIHDLSNGTGNWFKSNSRIDALYKIISNSEEAINAKNINTRFSGKYIVSGTQDPSDVTKTPMGEDEKRDIETKMNGKKQIYGMKSIIEIKRFVDDLSKLELGKAYLEDYFLIGSMYGIPRDVLEAYNSATYENQEKATAKHISYTLQPKGDDFMNSLSNRFGYTQAGKEIKISWDHLPFMQVMEAERSKMQKTKVDTFCLLLDQGVELDEVNAYLDLNFKTGKANAKPTTITAANQGAA